MGCPYHNKMQTLFDEYFAQYNTFTERNSFNLYKELRNKFLIILDTYKVATADEELKYQMLRARDILAYMRGYSGLLGSETIYYDGEITDK